MTDVTKLLNAATAGDRKAAGDLLPLVYDELRKLAAAKLAAEKPGQTLQATALVHEAYVRLVGGDQPQDWNSRGHFFAAAAEAMRRILVNRARDKGRERRGGGLRRVELDGVLVADQASEEGTRRHRRRPPGAGPQEWAVRRAVQRLFLAMSYHRLGRGADARQHFQNVTRWMRDHADQLKTGAGLRGPFPGAHGMVLKRVHDEAEGSLIEDNGAGSPTARAKP